MVRIHRYLFFTLIIMNPVQEIELIIAKINTDTDNLIDTAFDETI